MTGTRPKLTFTAGAPQEWLGGAGALFVAGNINSATLTPQWSDDAGTNWTAFGSITAVGIMPFILPAGVLVRVSISGSPSITVIAYSEAGCWTSPASTTSVSGGAGDASAANQVLQLAQETAINTVLGAKADAKSAATDTTSISHTSILKQISASAQVCAANWPTTVDTNSGAKSASTIRVVLATDQPALTNKLLVTPDSVALPANQSVNINQINGVTPLMGAGSTGTGALRVSIADDSPPGVAKGQQVEVIPTVTAGSYTAGFVMGGIMTFASVLPANFIGVLESITLKFKGSVQTGEYVLAIFNANPAGGTYADHGAPTFNSADQVRLLGEYSLTANKSSLGTQTCYNLDGIGKALVGASTSLYGVLIAKGATTNNLASTTDVSVMLGVV